MYFRDVHLNTYDANELLPRAHERQMTHAVSNGAQFVEGLDVEPGAFVSGCVQHHPHGVLLQQGGKTLVHRQVLVALQVEELGHRGEKLHLSFMVSAD